jgi:hypothetical protein
MKTPFIATALLLLISLPLLGTAAQWVGFRLARVQINSVTVFYGAPLTTFSLFGDAIAIGYIPTGSSIAFDIPQFSSRPLPVRLAVILSSSAALFLLAAALLGFSSSWHHFVSGFSQLLGGALRPRTTALGLIAQLQVVFSTSFTTTAGIVASKLTAFSLLPLGGMATAECIRQLLGPFGTHSAVTVFFTLSGLSAIVLGLCWAVAIVLYASTGNA